MNIHEYQAKEVLARHGVPVPKGIPCDTPAQVRQAFTDLGGGLAVVKAQIHAGGRGKAGGVKLVRSADDAEKIAQGLIGKTLVTPQTGPEGRVVKKLYVTQGADIDREMYLAVAMDRPHQEHFARAALALRYDDGAAPITSDRLLALRRWDDNQDNLWTTFNRVQENMIKGGVRGRTANGRNMSTRAVGGVTENVKLNKALWTLADEYAKLAA